ncbi:MAG: hypothetical protein SNJ75_17070 [Gemmataceae bacterium]
MRFRLLSLLTLLSLVAVASARIAAPPPIAVRVASADVVFVGKVTGFGDKMVPADLEMGDDRQMQLATVEVNDQLLGKVEKKVQVGFFPAMGRRPGLQLEPNDTALFLVRQHPKLKNIYVAEMFYSAVREKENPTFKTQVEEAKSATKLLANPLKGLNSKDADERYLTAALLITRYRRATPGAKLEPVPPAESKLILETLAEADWQPRNPKFYSLPATSLFGQLGVTEKDGWTPPTDFNQYATEAKKWLKANAAKFKMQRYAPAKTSISEEP